MKKTLLIFLIIFIAGFLVWFAFFYWQNLRGAAPAIVPPEQDISQLIPPSEPVSSEQPTVAADGENKTNLPLKLPESFSVSIFARNLFGARVMAFDGLGNMWVSRTGAGIITNLEIAGGVVKSQSDIFRNLARPHGLVFDPDNGTLLYFAEENKISKVPLYTEASPQKIVDLPAGGRHFTRTLLFGPDGKLYVSIGSSCDTCVESDQRRASIYSLDKNGGNFSRFASGLRNSVFLAVHQKSREIWATDMGRDFLGDNLPPDEINIIKKGDYGWPYCYGKNIHDDSFDSSKKVSCEEKTPSHIDIPAHSAPLGLAFVPENSNWPAEYKNNLLVAYHGSWNRSVPTGYKIVRYKLDGDGNYVSEEDFIAGWISDGSALGRPVDLKFGPDGALYVSDDKAGVIYKIEHK